MSNNLSITGIALKNFLSVGNATQALKLDEHGLTLVLGNNSDANGGVTKNGAGKAQPLSSRIKVPNGWTTMGEINVGDKVTAWDGTTSSVVSVHPQGLKKIYEFTFSDGRTARACEDHLWRVWLYTEGKWQWATLDTKSLIEHTSKKIPSRRAYVPLCYHEETHDASFKLSPRFVGLMIGDGGFTGSKITFSSKDEELLDYIRQELPEGYHLRFSSGCDYVITRGNNGRGKACFVRQVLSELGLLGKYSYEKIIPSQYMNASAAQKIELLSGLLDTDGTVGRNGDVSFTTTSAVLARQVVDLVRSLGGLAKIKNRVTSYTHKGEKKSGRPSFTVTIRYRNPSDLFLLRRKLERFNDRYQYSESLKLEISDIQYVGDEEAKCIMIDHHDHLYVTDNFVVTHNTTILQALSFGLFGQPLTKIKVDNLINNINGKNMHVVIDFEKAGVKYRIERGRRPNIMKFYIDGKDVTDKKNEAKGENSETQNDINDIIGMTHTMFTHIVALNTYTDPFLKLAAGKQREVIEELLGVTQISARAERLKALISESKDRIKTLEANIAATKAANARIQTSIQNAEENASQWLKKHNENLDSIRSQLEAVQNIDFDSELKKFDDVDMFDATVAQTNNDLRMVATLISQMEREISSLTNERKRFERDLDGNGSAAAASRMEKEIQRHQASIATMKASLEHEIEQVAHFEKLLENPDEHDCKTCGQQLTGTDHLKYVIKRFEEERDTHSRKAEKLRGDISSLSGEIEGLEADKASLLSEGEAKKQNAIKEIARLDSEIESLKGDLSSKITEKQSLTETLNDLGTRPDVLFASRDEVYAIKHLKETLLADLARETDATNPYDSQIEGFKSALQEIDMGPLNEVHETLGHQEFLFKLLTNKDSFIRKKIIEQNLAFLNQRLNQYLNKLGLPHEVIFQSDLSVEITLLGRDFDFAQLSRGESNRVIMATSWAFRDVWESLNNRVNVLWVDEMIDSGLDSNGAEAALQILKSFSRAGRNVFLISHRDELIGRIDRTLLVSKQNGFTSISEQV